jgi:hypothetical protein
MLPDYSTVLKAQKVCEDLRTSTARVHGSLGSVEMLLGIMGDCVYHPVNLVTQSYVPKDIYLRWGEKALWFVDFRISWTADALTEYFKAKVTANNWHENGKFQYRGFRPSTCKEGADLSQHRFGRALDCDIEGISASEVRKEIISQYRHPAFRYITCIEDSVNWLHYDCRNTRQENLLIVKP